VAPVHLAPVYGQSQGQPEDKTIAVFGQAIHYWDVGSGPVVVLVHGLGSRKEDWLPVLEPLAQKYRLLVPDRKIGQAAAGLQRADVRRFFE